MYNVGDAFIGLFYIMLAITAVAFFLAFPYVVASIIWDPDSSWDKCSQLEDPERIVECMMIMEN